MTGQEGEGEHKNGKQERTKIVMTAHYVCDQDFEFDLLTAFSDATDGSPHASSHPVRLPRPSHLETSSTHSPTATIVTVGASRGSRSQTVSQGISPLFASPVKRKPLSKTASPLATRFSSGEHLVVVSKKYECPQKSLSRSCPVDSPTLNDFQSLAVIAAASTSHLPPLEVEEGYQEQQQKRGQLQVDRVAELESESRPLSPQSSFNDHSHE